MLASLAELLADVRSLICEETENYWKDAEITRWLNQGQDIFAVKTKCLSAIYTRTLEASDIVNDRELRLPSDFVAFDEGGVYYDGVQLSPKSMAVYNNWISDWTTDTGTPTSYYKRGDYLGFYPPPSAGAVVKVYAIERAPTLTGAVVPLSDDYRVVAYRRYIRDYALAWCWYKKNEMQKYGEALMSFKVGLAEAVAELVGDKNQSGMMIPDRKTRAQDSYSIQYGRTDVYL